MMSVDNAGNQVRARISLRTCRSCEEMRRDSETIDLCEVGRNLFVEINRKQFVLQEYLILMKCCFRSRIRDSAQCG